MKLDPSDNRVAKSQEHKTRAEADAHIATHLANYPDAFVHEELDSEPVVDYGGWQFDPTTKDVLGRTKRPKLARSWAYLRAERDTNLSKSDWTQGNDSQLDSEAKVEWATYRQSLRDLPANTPDPANPTWPTPPE
jgi:hypothetical protein